MNIDEKDDTENEDKKDETIDEKIDEDYNDARKHFPDDSPNRFFEGKNSFLNI